MHGKLGTELSVELQADGAPSFVSLPGQDAFYFKEAFTSQI
jgi:hypothetical protein